MNLNAKIAGAYLRSSFRPQIVKCRSARSAVAVMLKSSFLHLALHPVAGRALAMVVAPVQVQVVVHVVTR